MMDAKQRTELLRARFKARKPSSSLPRAKAKPKPVEQRGPKAGRMAMGSLGLALAWNWGRTEWVQAPNAAPDPSLLRLVRSGDKPSTLSKIAEKAAPKKLLRRFLKAEGLLSEKLRADVASS